MSGTNITLASILKAYLTRILAILLGLVAMISGGKAGKIEMEVTQPVTVSSEQIVIEIRNYSGKSAELDEIFVLEKKDGDEWTIMDFAENVGFPEIVTELNNLGTYKQSIDVMRMFGHTLEAGEYKLTKQINQKDCFVVFTVTEQ